MEEEVNQSLLAQVGTGALFPIELTTKQDSGVNQQSSDGKVVVGWYPKAGDINLIKQNLISIINYQIGQFMRNEEFGTMLWDLLEEPNTPVLEAAVQQYIENGISAWEPRITALGVKTYRSGETIYVTIRFRVSETASELNIAYNTSSI